MQRSVLCLLAVIMTCDFMEAGLAGRGERAPELFGAPFTMGPGEEPESPLASPVLSLRSTSGTPLFSIEISVDVPPVPAGGGTVEGSMVINNLTGTTREVEVWIQGVLPDGHVKYRGPVMIMLGPMVSVQRSFSILLHEGSPSGSYTVAGFVGTDPGEIEATDTAAFYKLPVGTVKLQAEDGTAGDAFGISVGVDGTSLIVGAGYAASFTGSAYVFVNDNGSWVEEAKLSVPGGLHCAGGTCEFGFSTDISGEYAIVGSPWEGCCIDGAAHIFQKGDTGWEETAELTFGLSREAGWSVGISGDYAIVGEPDWLEGTVGAATVFHRNGDEWDVEAVLSGDSDEEYSYFGIAVAISGAYLVVGEPCEYCVDTETGAAYVYRRDGDSWVREAKLLPSDGAPHDEFGQSVTVSGESVLIAGGGAAYLFRRNGGSWDEEAILAAGGGENLGAVALDGERAVAGGPESVHLFAKNGATWEETGVLTAIDGMTGDSFGASVSLGDGEVVVGAYGDDEERGSVYVVSDPFAARGGSAVASEELHRSASAATAAATSVSLEPNYPNPFNPATTISYSLGRDMQVTLTIHNILGEVVSVLVEGFQAGGHHSTVWDGTNSGGHPVAGGVYFYRLGTEDGAIARPLILLK